MNDRPCPTRPALSGKVVSAVALGAVYSLLSAIGVVQVYLLLDDLAPRTQTYVSMAMVLAGLVTVLLVSGAFCSRGGRVGRRC